MCTFKPFQSVDGTSDNSSGSFGVVVKHELPAIDAQSYDSDDTCQNQEVEWRKVPLEDVSSRASPEVLGAVDLLSLKRATWGEAAPFQTQLQVSRHPDSDYGCPATLGHASVAWCSDIYLHASAPLNVPRLLARTAKRQVCFVGHRSHELGRWVFDLNSNLPWSEVSRETKQRLRSLPKEAEQAFVHKYPVRDPSGWQDKALKYKPGCSSDAYDIAMGPLVSDLHNLYLKHEVHSRRSLHMMGI